MSTAEIATEEKRAGNFGKWLIFLIVAGVVVGAGVGLWLYSPLSQRTVQSPTQTNISP